MEICRRKRLHTGSATNKCDMRINCVSSMQSDWDTTVLWESRGKLINRAIILYLIGFSWDQNTACCCLGLFPWVHSCCVLFKLIPVACLTQVPLYTVSVVWCYSMFSGKMLSLIPASFWSFILNYICVFLESAMLQLAVTPQADFHATILCGAPIRGWEQPYAVSFYITLSFPITSKFAFPLF